MAVSLKLKACLPRLKSPLHLQRSICTLVEEGLEAELFSELGPKTMVAPGPVDTSKWKKLDSRTLGVNQSMIPESSRIVLRILQNEGHDAYLVGGCVRDLLLNRIPKDFDVITSAKLHEIKKQFHRAFIVGWRFPICRVHVRGSVIEVSSFETVAKDAKAKEDVYLSEMPKGYNEKDFMRWKNSLHRDFTINSLFYDPFAQRIYDYSSGMADLTSMMLRTLVPAHLLFQEDCARILRGLRIAARLGLIFAKDTEKAIFNLHASVTDLDKGRLMMEMNYMLSYGAAESSLLLLRRFNLLKLLLPFHAAYLDNQAGSLARVMLMKLFFNLDRMVSCDQPCDSGLWVSLLAFHLALVNNPQDALVISTLSSALYHGKWIEGVKSARELAAEHVNFVPEISESSSDITDEELAQKVANFASIVLDAIEALTDSESLKKAMECYPSAPCSGTVFISKNAGKEAIQIFGVLVNDVESLSIGRQHYNINYKLLGGGNIEETRFVLGKVIMDTMRSGVAKFHTKLDTRICTKLFTEKKDDLHTSGPKTERAELEKSTSTVSELVETPKPKDGVAKFHTKLDNRIRTKLAAEKKDDLHTSRPKTESTEMEESSSTVSELKTPKPKGGVKRVLSTLDDQPHQRGSKKKKKKTTMQKALDKEVIEILSCKNIAKKNQQLKKVVVKDVSRFLSLQKKSAKKSLKLEKGKKHETPSPREMHGVQATEEMMNVVQKAPKLKPKPAKQHKAQAPNEPKMTEQHKAEAPNKTLLNVLKDSNMFKGEKKITSKDDDTDEQIVGEQTPQRIGRRRLSSLFQ